ncbi:MAG: acyl carrier protein [Actinobacteria bacterium]|jgi:acyl carrier protein|nr:MAG: acyl carrier protein [Actinomycetota bacterium]
MSDLSTQIRHFIAREIMLQDDPSVVTEKTRLIGGVMDSLGLMQFVSYLREEFDLNFDEDEIVPENFRTVTDVERLVNQKLAARAGSGRPGSG